LRFRGIFRVSFGVGVVDRYEKLRLLGEGGTGRVWLARDRSRGGRLVALKELLAAGPGKEDSLRKEFATLSALRHPGLVEVMDFDVDEESRLPRFSMDYVEGEDFGTAVRREGFEVLASLVAEALGVLSFLHDFGLIHRDLKPGNLLVRKKARLGQRVVVLDFGLAMRGGREPSALGLEGTPRPSIAPRIPQ